MKNRGLQTQIVSNILLGEVSTTDDRVVMGKAVGNIFFEDRKRMNSNAIQLKTDGKTVKNSAFWPVFEAYSQPRRDRLLQLRALIFETARQTEGVGELEESLKWGQPTYSTVRPKSGSPIRIDAVKNSGTQYAAYFICTTNLVETFRQYYPDSFTFQGNRALIFDTGKPLPKQELPHCLAMAMTYFVRKRQH